MCLRGLGNAVIPLVEVHGGGPGAGAEAKVQGGEEAAGDGREQGEEPGSSAGGLPRHCRVRSETLQLSRENT